LPRISGKEFQKIVGKNPAYKIYVLNPQNAGIQPDVVRVKTILDHTA